MAQAMWRYGSPVPQRWWGQQPYQNVATPAATRTPYSAILSGYGEPGGGVSQPSMGGISGYGPYGSTTGNLSAIGGKAVGTGLNAALAGASITPASMVGLAIPMASLIARLAGVTPGQSYSPADIQAIADIYGWDAANAAAGRMAGDLSQGANPATTEQGQMAGPASVGYSGAMGSVSMGPGSAVGGYVGGPPSNTAAPSVSNPDSVFGGGGGNQGGGDTGGGGIGGGTGTAEGGGGEQFGGVRKTKPGKPRVSVYGEGKASAEGETGIFIPNYMKQPGFQGQEQQVRKGLKSAYSSLTGGKRR